MKATISKNGLLEIESESALESFALEHWIAEQAILTQQKKNYISSDSILFVYSCDKKVEAQP